MTFSTVDFNIDQMKRKKFDQTGRSRVSSIAVVLCLFSLMALPVIGQEKTGQEKTGSLKGKLTDEKGKPIAGAVVRLTNTRDRSVKETQTDASGSFSIDLQPDEYLVGFQAEGYQEASLQALQQVEAGKETRVKPVILPKASHSSLVRGSVFNLSGQTLAGVKVTIERIPTDEEQKDGKHIKSHTRDYLTNAHGEFAFRLPAQPARYRVTAAARGFKSDTKVVDVNGSEAVPVALTLLPRKDKG